MEKGERPKNSASPPSEDSAELQWRIWEEEAPELVETAHYEPDVFDEVHDAAEIERLKHKWTVRQQRVRRPITSQIEFLKQETFMT